MTPEKQKRKTAHENTTIIKTKTLQLIEKFGYASTSMNKISEETGINISLIYRYFPNGKPDILKSIGEDLIQNSKSSLDLDKITDPISFLTQLITRFIKMHRQHQTLLLSLTVAYLSNKEIFDQENFDIITGDLKDPIFFIKILEKLGASKNQDLNYEAQMIFHLMDCMIHRHIITIPIGRSDEDLASYLANIIFNRIESLKK